MKFSSTFLIRFELWPVKSKSMVIDKYLVTLNNLILGWYNRMELEC